MLRLLFPPKCILCRKLLKPEETDLCHDCRKDTPEFKHGKNKIPFIAQWTALWYYKDSVRSSILRYKFSNAQSYCAAYARMLALKIQKEQMEDLDIITWAPVSTLRRFKRGYDQSQLLANALGAELNCPVASTLKKIRNIPPQSGIQDKAARKANVMGVYRARNPEYFRDKRILLIDDVVTSGSTASECARILLTAGAKEIYLAAVAASDHENNKNCR